MNNIRLQATLSATACHILSLDFKPIVISLAFNSQTAEHFLPRRTIHKLPCNWTALIEPVSRSRVTAYDFGKCCELSKAFDHSTSMHSAAAA
jgi:hypothetical protein